MAGIVGPRHIGDDFTVAFRAPNKCDLIGDRGKRSSDRLPLIGDAHARQEERVLAPTRERTVPRKEDPLIVAGDAQDLVVGPPARIDRVAPDEPQVAGEASDHLVGHKAGRRHGP